MTQLAAVFRLPLQTNRHCFTPISTSAAFKIEMCSKAMGWIIHGPPVTDGSFPITLGRFGFPVW